eukprot:TRINITY_DN292_c0_g1_i1.p1 TRINITY_DN292_c0_g1~~TRINITY_DN292_c0_g1_i1.p1  ORF type:complete len:196 (-),score=27.31 TRINITY_DN292_c0_g1_i1:84-671(-)
MNLSTDVKKGLDLFSQEKIFTDEIFKQLIVSVVQIILKQKKEEVITENKVFESIDKLILKHAYAALYTVLVEACKKRLDSELLVSTIQDHRWNKTKLDLLSKIYEEKIDEMRLILSLSTFHFPHIVDIDWRLDYYVKSTEVSRVDRPVWLITFKTYENDSNELKDYTFTCDLQELQDLLIRLKDAVKQVERVTGK